MKQIVANIRLADLRYYIYVFWSCFVHLGSGHSYNRPLWTLYIIILMMEYFLGGHIKRGENTGKHVGIIIVFAINLVITQLQSVFFGGGTVAASIYRFIYLLLPPYLLLQILKERLFIIYIKIMVVMTVIGLMFYLIVNISYEAYLSVKAFVVAAGTDYIIDHYFILWSLRGSRWESASHDILFLSRNSGPFWEPGLYATYLFIAIILCMLLRQVNYRKYIVIFIVAIATTFSTAAYLALFVMFLPVLKSRYAIINVVLLIILLFLSYQAYFGLDFLGTKIDTHWETQMDIDLTTPTSGRFLGARKSIVVLSRYPLFGRGLIGTRADAYSDEDGAYGFLGFASRIGLPAFILYVMYFNKSIKILNKQYRSLRMRDIILIYVSLTLLLFAQQSPLGSTIMWSLVYYSFNMGKNRNNVTIQ